MRHEREKSKRKIITSQMIANSASAPNICAREKRITLLQQKLGQFRIRRAHQRAAFRFKHGHESLPR